MLDKESHLHSIKTLNKVYLNHPWIRPEKQKGKPQQINTAYKQIHKEIPITLSILETHNELSVLTFKNEC